MIQIQIATSLTELGVGDIRWVLLESGESVEPVDGQGVGSEAVTLPAPPPEPAQPELPAVASDPEASRPGRRWLGGLALVASVAAAGWMASSLADRTAADPPGRTSWAAQK